MFHRGLFITLEGGEGSGKSTLQASLSERLRGSGYKIVTTREPGGTPLAEAVRNLALHPPGDDWSSLSEALLMNAARADHLDKVIRPALERGAWVICDRFSDSTLAYQSVEGGVSFSALKKIEKLVLGKTRPDLTFVLDAPIGQLRVRRGSEKDAFESRGLEFHHAVREAFLRIADEDPDRCIVLDALKGPHEVLADALRSIKTYIDDAQAA